MEAKDFEKIGNKDKIWCTGCGLYFSFNAVTRSLAELKILPKNLVVVSGIGCSGRAAGYFQADSAHVTHGRAVPVAEGMKLANPRLNILVFSGDGDLLGIGGNHLIHAARANVDITVFCMYNEIYGMTGGQSAPTTRLGARTKTNPIGVEMNPINPQGLIISNDQYFFARTTVAHSDHMAQMITKAIKHRGFSFVEVRSNCITNFGRFQGVKAAGQMLADYKKIFSEQKNKGELDKFEIGYLEKK